MGRRMPSDDKTSRSSIISPTHPYLHIEPSRWTWHFGVIRGPTIRDVMITMGAWGWKLGMHGLSQYPWDIPSKIKPYDGDRDARVGVGLEMCEGVQLYAKYNLREKLFHSTFRMSPGSTVACSHLHLIAANDAEPEGSVLMLTRINHNHSWCVRE